jgi:hypothetical protein
MCARGLSITPADLPPISFYEIRCTGRPLAVAAIDQAAAAACVYRKLYPY